MKKKFTFKIMLLLFALVVGIGNAMSQSDPYYTLDTEASGNTSSNNSYTGTGSVTVDGIKWYVVGNSGIQPWRLGGKASTTSTTATLVVNRPVYTDDEMDEKIESIKLYIGDVTVNTFTSVTLTVASTTSFSGDDIIDEITNSSPSANSTLTFTPTSGSYWNEDSFYKFTITATLKGKSNTYVQFKKVEFFNYTSSGGDPIQLSAPSLTAVQSPGKVTLTWDAVSNASSYTIQYADNSSFTGATTVENAISPKEITGLTNGTAYYFKAMSVGNDNTYLSSEYGDAVSATPASVQLTAPTLTATPGNAKATLTWDAVSNASSCTIQYANNSEFTNATTVENATSPKEISGLTNGTTYYFKARSVGDGTNYTPSDYGSAVSTTPVNTATITITQDNLTDFTNSYAWYDWSSGGVSGKAYAYKNSGMQFNSDKTGYWIYNSSVIPGTITAVKMTKASGTDRTWTLEAGTSALTTIGSGTAIGNAQTVGTTGATWDVSGTYNYFLLYVSGGSTVISSIEITYIPSTDPSITAEDVNIAYNANGNISYTLTNPVTGGEVTAAITAGNTENWLSIGDPSNNNASGTVALTCGTNEGAERTATVTLTYTYGNSKTKITKAVLVTQQAPPQTYTLATSIESGKHYIITNGSTIIMGSQNTNNRVAVDVSEEGYYDNENNEYTIPSDAGIYVFVIIGPDVDGYYTIYDESNKGYLYAASSSANQLKTQNNIDNDARWKITFDGTKKFASIVAEESSNRNVMQYNSGNSLFACYASASQSDIYLYAKNNEVTISEDLNISAYDPENGTKSGYYLIAPPVGQVTPTADNNFLDNSYDLYRFNQSGMNGEWENWKAENTTHYHFNLVSGRGYLYANSADVQLTFEGYQYVGNGQVFLSYDGDATFAGWNLIGNPWNQSATVGCAYYKMNNQGTDLEAATASDPVAAMQGIFVHASTNGDNVTFTKPAKGSAKSAESHIVLNIIDKNNNVIDRAIVCFDEGGTLPKFMLDESNTKIYIPREDDNYAIVRSEGKGTMPVNFKAKQMGKYTISVNTEGVNMDYLHLIDRLTGEDVNLLLDNSYSFIASAQDVESRFILSFTASGYNQDADEPFAFQNGSDIIVNGTGELQIFDLMGRMVSTQNVNGIETINVKSQGVYIFRLNEKTQKIVVR